MPVQVAISLLLAALDHAQQISQIIAAVHASGADDLTPDQWNSILASDDKARAALAAAVGQTPPVQ